MLGRQNGEVVGGSALGGNAQKEAEAVEAVLACLSVDDAIKQYVAEVARDPAISSDQALWEAVGPLLVSSGSGEDEGQVRHVLAQVRSPLFFRSAALHPACSATKPCIFLPQPERRAQGVRTRDLRPRGRLCLTSRAAADPVSPPQHVPALTALALALSRSFGASCGRRARGLQEVGPLQCGSTAVENPM